VRGRTAIAAWEAENENGFRIAFDIQEKEGSGDTAYVRGRSCVFIPDGDGGYGVDVGKFLELRKKQADGAWLIEADIFNSNAAQGSELLESCPIAPLP
jgi:ketosteroid isomerase-like protein